MSDSPMLRSVGTRVRELRAEVGLSRRQLSVKSGVSERFLAHLEQGHGNISLIRFARVAKALGTTASALLDGIEAEPLARVPIALLGVRGAGKSTVGAALARNLGVPFVELDQRIEQAAGLSLAEIFEVHGESHYRQLQRAELEHIVAGDKLIVLATGGSIVNDTDAYQLLRNRTRTVWLKATAEDHWNRVIKQGDRRPMAENPSAFSQLKQLLAKREPLYAQADYVIETSSRTVDQVVTATLAAVGD